MPDKTLNEFNMKKEDYNKFARNYVFHKHNHVK